jgi:hypothetical protein
VDGRWGTETAGGLERAQTSLGVTGSLDNVGRYRAFLEAVARRGFATAPGVGVGVGVGADVEDTPRRRLKAVYGIIEAELGQTAARKRIETALTGFVGHPEVRRVVGG